jgi:hypothetical protein
MTESMRSYFATTRFCAVIYTSSLDEVPAPVNAHHVSALELDECQENIRKYWRVEKVNAENVSAALNCWMCAYDDGNLG